MLTKDPIFQGKLVEAWLEPSYRRVEEPTAQIEVRYEQQRFQYVVDEMDTVLASVGKHYRVVRNADFVAALDMAADAGIVLHPNRAEYAGGRSFYRFAVPDYEMRVGRDPSPVTPIIELRNDYRGLGGLRIMSGWYRQVCTNGLIVGTVAYRNMQRHVGAFDLHEFVKKGLDAIVAKFDEQADLANKMADTPVEMPHELPANRESAIQLLETNREMETTPSIYTQILADTPNRYNQELQYQLDNYQRRLGSNAWAIMQAVSDVSTHRMQQGRRFNASADDWASRQLQRVLSLV